MSLYCGACGNQRIGKAKFCTECGNQFNVSEKIVSQSDFKTHISHYFLNINDNRKVSRADVHSSFYSAINAYSQEVTGSPFFTSFNLDSFDFEFDKDSKFLKSGLLDCFRNLIESVEINESQIPALASCIDYSLNKISGKIPSFMKLVNQSIGFEGWHILNLGMIFDFENDQNLLTFYDSEKAESHVNFYLKMFPQGISDFLFALEEASDIAKSSKINLFGKIQNRIEFWKVMSKYYRNNLNPASTSVREVLESVDWLKGVVKYLNLKAPHVLDETYLALIQCVEGEDGPPQVLIFSEVSVTQICVKDKDLRRQGAIIQKKENIQEISVGSHTSKVEGIGSVTQIDWILTIQTLDHKEYVKSVYMGKNEREVNESRPKLMSKIKIISNFYEIVEGEDLSTTTTMRLTPSIGIWRPL